jgi:hypothetical protein
MKARIITADELRYSEGREYNPSAWDKEINSYLKYENVVFYIVERGDGYGYERYFAEYTIPSGIRFFNSVSYSSTITSGGFYRLDKLPIAEDGRNYTDAFKLFEDGKMEEAKQLMKELEESKFFNISYGKFYNEGLGKTSTINNSREAREWMAERSSKNGMTFTKG